MKTQSRRALLEHPAHYVPETRYATNGQESKEDEHSIPKSESLLRLHLEKLLLLGMIVPSPICSDCRFRAAVLVRSVEERMKPHG